jgi:hypothetical protein
MLGWLLGRLHPGFGWTVAVNSAMVMMKVEKGAMGKVMLRAAEAMMLARVGMVAVMAMVMVVSVQSVHLVETYG